MAKSGERATRKNMKSQPTTSKLADLGVTKSQSSRWQEVSVFELKTAAIISTPPQER